MGSIEGDWKLTQSIDGHTFTVQFGENGTMNVDNMFFGTWIQNGDSGQVQFALTDSAPAPAPAAALTDAAPAGSESSSTTGPGSGGSSGSPPRSLTIYEGFIVENYMGGVLRGLPQSGPAAYGNWSASRSM